MEDGGWRMTWRENTGRLPYEETKEGGGWDEETDGKEEEGKEVGRRNRRRKFGV
jgi:hypothetical protein